MVFLFHDYDLWLLASILPQDLFFFSQNHTTKKHKSPKKKFILSLFIFLVMEKKIISSDTICIILEGHNKSPCWEALVLWKITNPLNPDFFSYLCKLSGTS